MVTSGLQLQELTSYIQRINDVLDTSPEQHGEHVRSAPPLSGQIRADGVSFSYGRLAPTVVSRVSLEIQPGQHIGIVGRSGSGKSTLAHLLLGLYRPTSGRIEFDGHDLAGLDAGSVRRQLGIVTQRPYPFGSSVRENIALTNPELPLEAITKRPRSPASTTTLRRCRWATIPRCMTGAPRSPGVSVSASRSPAPSSTGP